ncbi:hypothetical protein JOC85_000727 [Bacillus mesophilus]|uniref:Uncharacterized protein n=1 Tax=Bacillus mesophilus TaxID=1808955 RepID=A0A6M0Q3P1_9BACI|nr:hypothetical protein [Bacillus mesophilus]MBM7659960.1 hypothetical protein [Bacillus mesophilus]NEY70822.1 hypothetical protein [Bacillus mesophilus]
MKHNKNVNKTKQFITHTSLLIIGLEPGGDGHAPYLVQFQLTQPKSIEE